MKRLKLHLSLISGSKCTLFTPKMLLFSYHLFLVKIHSFLPQITLFYNDTYSMQKIEQCSVFEYIIQNKHAS